MTSLPYARTFDEAYLYMDLRPCPCGESDFDKTSTAVAAPEGTGRQVVRLSGECARCGRHRQFSFEMPDTPPDLSAEVRYGDGEHPSRLLDAGEWIGIAELFESNARDLLTDDPGADDDLSQAHYLASAAMAATEEAMLFLPAGDAADDAVPEGAFWSQAGRTIFELEPERFVRARLVAEHRDRLDALRDLLDRAGGPA